MKRTVIAAVALAFLGASGAALAQGPGKCPKGEKWNAKDGKCEPAAPKAKGKKKGSGSGSG